MGPRRRAMLLAVCLQAAVLTTACHAPKDLTYPAQLRGTCAGSKALWVSASLSRSLPSDCSCMSELAAPLLHRPPVQQGAGVAWCCFCDNCTECVAQGEDVSIGPRRCIDGKQELSTRARAAQRARAPYGMWPSLGCISLVCMPGGQAPTCFRSAPPARAHCPPHAVHEPPSFQPSQRTYARPPGAWCGRTDTPVSGRHPRNDVDCKPLSRASPGREQREGGPWVPVRRLRGEGGAAASQRARDLAWRTCSTLFTMQRGMSGL